MVRRATRPARLDDVAREAGFHVSTVSRVLNGSGTVSIRPETRERIVDTARRLGYRPHAIARSLKTATTGALGLLVPSLRNPVNSPIIRGAFDRAWERNFVLMLAEDSDESAAEDAYARLVEEGRIDGLLIQSARADNPWLDRFADGRVPCVFMDRCHPGSGRNVHMRDGDAGRLVAEHLLELGHTRLGHLAGPADIDTLSRRAEGFVAGCRPAGVVPVLLEAPLTEQGGYDALFALLERPEPPTAVFVANISQAVGALAGARAAGVGIPTAISLVCHDDDPTCDFLDPPLTAVAMPLYELGGAAVDALVDQIEGGEPRDIVVTTPPRLVPRSSTASPAAP